MNHIGRYGLVRVLGSGAFATVWLARDEDLDIDVAIKVLAENWSADAGVRERFLHEARLLRRISSPRVVRVHDVGVHDGRPYFVMDHVERGTLADVGTAGWPADVALWLGAEACFATQVLHEAGVLHRDIKPSNLLVGGAGPRPPLLVADLGLAKAIAEGSGFTVTAGTPAYTAPEQARGGTLDARTDVYSLAVVTYELLCGRRPYPVGGMGEVLGRDPTSTAPPLARELGLPVALDALLAGALALDPGRRPGSAAELGQALLALGAAPGPTTAAVGDVHEPATVWPTRSVVLLTLLAFLCAAVTAYLLAPV
jgi:eukaryotic-like serine/threonine-protein kinase